MLLLSFVVFERSMRPGVDGTPILVSSPRATEFLLGQGKVVSVAFIAFTSYTTGSREEVKPTCLP
jgi:hypothetical protein